MWSRIAVAALALVLVGCNPGSLEAQPFEGIWQSEGWGSFLLVGGDVEFFEHTPVHCLSVGTAGGRGIADLMSFEGDRLLLRDSDREVRFDRIEVLPPTCAEAGPSNDPVFVVDVLAATVEEHLIGELDPEWADRHDRIRAQAGADEDLAALVWEMVAPLGGRVRLATSAGVAPEPPTLDLPDGVEQTEDAYAVGLIGDVGYLGLGRTGPFESDPDESARVMGRIVDEALVGRAVIVDLRASWAGTLNDGLLLATRFVPEHRVVASLRARAGEGLVPAGDLTVTPVPTGVFDGPVFVLVGPGTAGVGELVAHVLGDLEGATILGLPTAGDPGPALVRYLPNGWSVSIPNLEVIGPDGSVLGPVQPDVVTQDSLGEALGLAG